MWAPRTYGVIGATGLIELDNLFNLMRPLFCLFGGILLKLIFSLTVLLISTSLLLLHTNSFTTAKVKNTAELSIAPEDHALIAISYGVGKKFFITNNTGRIIEIEKVGLVSRPNQVVVDKDEFGSSFIPSGEVKKFTIIGNPKGLIGNQIQIKVRWNGGSADINSTIPETIVR